MCIIFNPCQPIINTFIVFIFTKCFVALAVATDAISKLSRLIESRESLELWEINGSLVQLAVYEYLRSCRHVFFCRFVASSSPDLGCQMFYLHSWSSILLWACVDSLYWLLRYGVSFATVSNVKYARCVYKHFLNAHDNSCKTSKSYL